MEKFAINDELQRLRRNSSNGSIGSTNANTVTKLPDISLKGVTSSQTSIEQKEVTLQVETNTFEPGQKLQEEVLQFEIKEKHRRRHYEKSELKIEKASDKTNYLSKNIIIGTNKDVERRQKKDQIHKIMKRLSQSFELDDIMEKDEVLKKQILQ